MLAVEQIKEANGDKFDRGLVARLRREIEILTAIEIDLDHPDVAIRQLGRIDPLIPYNVYENIAYLEGLKQVTPEQKKLYNEMWDLV